MRQNIYDDESFFHGYADLRANPGNFNDLVEQPALRALLPALAGRRVLDLGCGCGDLAAYCADQGTGSVIATDISARMLAVAREKNARPAIEYRQAAMEDLTFDCGSFDLVVSSLALHYVQEYEALVGNVARWLTPGGSFVFSVEHPIITARKGEQGWVRDEEGRRLYWPVNDYGEEGRRRFHWLVEGVVKYHRTLSTLLNTLVQHGLTIAEVQEPQASQEVLRKRSAFVSLTDCPSCLIVKSVLSQPVSPPVTDVTQGGFDAVL